MIVVAHRGASAYAPENTLAALREARRRGADMVEVDIRRTADGAFVAMHDSTLGRTTDVRRRRPGRRPWRVADFTLAEIRELDAGAWFGERYAGERVPTLEEVLCTLRGLGLGALVELKARRGDPASVGGLVRILAADSSWRADPGALTVQSFDHGAIRRLAGALPGLRTAVLGRVHRDPALRRVAGYACQVNPCHLYVDAAYVRRVHSHGLALFGWTANAENLVRKVLRAGADGIISDRPDLVARCLRETAVRISG